MTRYSKKASGRLYLSAKRKRRGRKKGYRKNRSSGGQQSQPEADGDYVSSRFREYQRDPYPTRNPSNISSVTVKQEIVTVDYPEHSDLTFSSLQNLLHESCPNIPSTTIKVEPPDDYPDPTLPLISNVRTYSRNNLRDAPSTSASVTLPLTSNVRTYSRNNLRDAPSTSASGTSDDLYTFIPSTVVDCQLGADDSPTSDDISRFESSNGATSIADDESELCDKCGSYIRKLDPDTGLPKTNPPKNVPVGGCRSSDCGAAGCNTPGCFRSMNNVMNNGGVVVMETASGKDGSSEAYMVEIGIDTNLEKMQTYGQMTALRLNRLSPRTCLVVQNAIEELLFNAEDGQYDLLETHKGLVKKPPVDHPRYLKQIGGFDKYDD